MPARSLRVMAWGIAKWGKNPRASELPDPGTTGITGTASTSAITGIYGR